MRRILLSIAVSCLALPALAGDFLDAMPDVPLMSGLAEASDDDMTFDVPEGRIVETLAIGQPSVDKVLAFYTRTLPQLGWIQAGETTFRRDGETLTLEAVAVEHTTRVTFRLSPQH
jgi:hypothetical protein